MYLLKDQRAIPENSFNTVEAFHFSVCYFFNSIEIVIKRYSKLVEQCFISSFKNIFRMIDPIFLAYHKTQISVMSRTQICGLSKKRPF